MTHSEALQGDRHHFWGRMCPGELTPTGRYPDCRLGSSGPVALTVTLYTCPECGYRLSIEDGGYVRKCYPFEVRSAVRELAERLDARPLLAPPIEE